MTYSEFRNQFSDTDSFMRAYGVLTYEEARALIDAENASTTIKACMITTWRQARRKVNLWNVSVNIYDGNRLTIVVYEDDSEFDGNDFEYRYSLDADNATAFMNMIPHPYSDMKTNIEEWLCENGLCKELGSDLQRKWLQMGLHGSHVVYEDYPGGIDREEAF